MSPSPEKRSAGPFGLLRTAAKRLFTPPNRKRPMLDSGVPAPDFTLPAHDGSTMKLAEQRGHRVVLWFYPKADTPG